MPTSLVGKFIAILGITVLAAGAGYVVWSAQETPSAEPTIAPLPTSESKVLPMLATTSIPVTAQSTTPTPIQATEISLGEEFTLRKDETAKIAGENASITVTDFIHSPCPSGVACVWSGLAVSYDLTVDGKVYKNTLSKPPQGTPYTVVMKKSDYKTYATFVITK